MKERTENSFFSRVLGIVKGIILFFLKIIYLIPFFALGIWLLSTVYLHDVQLKSPVPEGKPSEAVLKVLEPKNESVPRDHFHMVDTYIKGQESNQPVCVICHGTYAHAKEKSVRSILNMHSGFIACSVCHIRQDIKEENIEKKAPIPQIEFLWVEGDSGELMHSAKGEYGKYTAVIYPIDKKDRQIYTPITEKAAREFLKTIPEQSLDQVKDARAKLHEPLTKKPVLCSDCHKKDGYIDYQELGFPKQRIDHLMSNEFVGMIEKYKTFYLPSVIDFRGE